VGDPLSLFHPAVRGWFARRFPDGPTEPQRTGWPPIAGGAPTLIAAPTGSGKTLAAFLVCIDALVRRAADGEALPDETQVVYVSPLKALAADVRHNLETPLAEIRAEAGRLGLALPELRVLVRSGDTDPAARAAMLRRPPHLLVTTPESLYLLLTAARSRERLRAVERIVVDEIHAVAGEKRGAHLALSLERLTALCARPPQRIALSATQRPVATVARLLVGAGPDRSDAEGRPACRIVDLGHRRALDLGLEVPESELGAVASAEQLGEILDRIAALVAAHRTTLVFVNTRRLAERVAHRLAERLGADRVAAHHGSLAKDRRARLEARLRSGELAALVATASLELGIDVGPVDLVCQLGSPRRFATLLQRVGRSGHTRDRVPRGRLFPTSRDELVECAALLRGVREGRLETLRLPEAPLDVLAQQVVAECAAAPCTEDALYALVRRAAPYADLAREDFEAVLELASEGVATGRGRVGAHLHRDRVNGRLRGRRGARLAALTSGGAIPENADYRVLADPDETPVGTVNEDFAVESLVGDVFLLGSTSWRVRRVEPGVVRVSDAQGAPPSIPFWLGEAPARSPELSEEVSRLRAEVGRALERGGVHAATAQLEAGGLGRDAAEQIALYLEAGRAALGVLPSRKDLVFERFFDETGGQQLVVHAPFGALLNRGLGLALRKRFCRSFDFELQAAANDDAVVLSLGPQHAFPLEAVARFLAPESVEDVLVQALLASPLFAVRWRWNLTRALLVLRRRGGRRNPPPLQRMQADDLLAALFPALAACAENARGTVEIPDHPIVRETLRDCLNEATDVEGLRGLLADLRRGAVRAHFRDTSEPSLLAHEILNGRPYTFLDDAPLEERRTRALALRRGLPEAARDLGRLDPEAVARVRAEVAPDPRDPDELHELLLAQVLSRPRPAWEEFFGELLRQGRAGRAEAGSGPLWLAAERRAEALALLPGARLAPDPGLPAALAARSLPPIEACAAEALRGHLEASGPATAAELAQRSGLAPELVAAGLARLEAEGFLLRGRFDPARPAGEGPEVCARALLARIHGYTREHLRREIEPVSARDLLRFLLRWQHVAPGTRREGRRGLRAALEQLQGLELAAGAWETSVLPARVEGYRPEWLDACCLSGEVVWGRLAPRGAESGRASAPSRATPLAFALREDWPWLRAAARPGAAEPAPPEGPAAGVLEALRAGGALFPAELAERNGLGAEALRAALLELVAAGRVSADGFAALRELLQRRARARRAPGSRAGARGRLRGRVEREAPAGRFACLPDAAPGLEREELAEAVAEQLLLRWGVVFRDLVVRESFALPWREVLRALRRLEARGTARGGRFVTGFVGEHFASPGAVEALRAVRRSPCRGERIALGAADPLNLVGVLTPGPRISPASQETVVYLDGLPHAPGAPTAAARGA
jgi:ATP-dependent Lhr-like helicase